jgi:hypothetical protein
MLVAVAVVRTRAIQAVQVVQAAVVMVRVAQLLLPKQMVQQALAVAVAVMVLAQYLAATAALAL